MSFAPAALAQTLFQTLLQPMGLRFFADQCVLFAVVQRLRDAGHEALILREHMTHIQRRFPCSYPVTRSGGWAEE